MLYMGHIRVYMGHIWVIYRSYMSTYGSHMGHICYTWVIYGPYMSIYGSYMGYIWVYMGHIWVIYVIYGSYIGHIWVYGSYMGHICHIWVIYVSYMCHICVIYVSYMSHTCVIYVLYVGIAAPGDSGPESSYVTCFSTYSRKFGEDQNTQSKVALIIRNFCFGLNFPFKGLLWRFFGVSDPQMGSNTILARRAGFYPLHSRVFCWAGPDFTNGLKQYKAVSCHVVLRNAVSPKVRSPKRDLHNLLSA